MLGSNKSFVFYTTFKSVFSSMKLILYTEVFFLKTAYCGTVSIKLNFVYFNLLNPRTKFCNMSNKFLNKKPTFSYTDLQITYQYFFLEFELVIEPEFESKTKNNQSKEYDLLTATTSSEKYSSEELDKMCSNQKSDEAFLKFKEKLACEPEQVNIFMLFMKNTCFNNCS